MKKKILAVVLSAILALSFPTAMVAEAYYNLPLDVGNTTAIVVVLVPVQVVLVQVVLVQVVQVRELMTLSWQVFLL